MALFAYDRGLIGRTHYQARLNFLRAIADPQGGAVHYADEMLGDDVVNEDHHWAESNAGGSGQSETFETTGTYFDDDDHSLAFKVVAGPLANWEFHQADDDFFPSIPHGHEYGNRQLKLDVYLGWIYFKDKQLRRIERTLIVRLWNDRSFRDFARTAIEYYLDHFPRYSGWRVADPRLLPVIRRGRRYM